jgi:hypothetical protein
VGKFTQSFCNVDNAVIVELPHIPMPATSNDEWQPVRDKNFIVKKGLKAIVKKGLISHNVEAQREFCVAIAW